MFFLQWAVYGYNSGYYGPISKGVGLHTAGEVWYLQLSCFNLFGFGVQNVWQVLVFNLVDAFLQNF